MKEKEIEQLQQDILVLFAEINLSILLEKITDKIKQYLLCEEASIFLYNPERQELYAETASGAKGDALKKIVLRKNQGVVGWIASHGEHVIVNDCANDDRFSMNIDKKLQFSTRSIAGVPVGTGDNLLGVLEAINKKTGVFTDHDIILLETIANRITVPLQNAILFRKITRETHEKEQLIELGKKISSSLDFHDAFAIIRDIILDMLNATEINIFIRSTGYLHDLLTGKSAPLTPDLHPTTFIAKRKTTIPMRINDTIIGFIEIDRDDPIAEDDLSMLRGLTAFCAIAIQKHQFIRDIVEKEKIQKELQIAKEIQRSFLCTEPILIPGLDIAYKNIPSSAVGGDYYEITPFTNSNIVVSIHDVSGHGVPASLLMSILRTNYLYFLKQSHDITKTCQHINNLISETTPTNLYVTSFVAELDLTANKMHYINAGHNPPYIIRKQSIVNINERTMVIGMMPDVDFSKHEIEIEPGDCLIMYTDGIVEAENQAGQEYSLPRLQRLTIEHSHAPAADIGAAIVADLAYFTEQKQFNDDITFIIVKIGAFS